jgi:hypothetical protein
VGIAGAVIGALGLAAPFAWTWFWPTPIATIDAPDANAPLAGCFVARGRVLPSTIWKPLWLIESWNGGGWQPLEKIDPSSGSWQRKTCVRGPTGGKFRLALVVADRERDAAFRHELEEEDPIPEWLRVHKDDEQGCRGHRRGYFPIPDGATAVASVSVRALEGDEAPCFGRVDLGPGGYLVVDPKGREPPEPPLWADQLKRLRRHAEQRHAGRVRLQRAVVGGVPGAVDRVGGGRP